MRQLRYLVGTFILIAPFVCGCQAMGPAYSGEIDTATQAPQTAVPGSIGWSGKLAENFRLTDTGQTITPAPAHADAPPAKADPAAAGPATTQAAVEPRQVIYSAGFRVVVADVPGAQRTIREAAERLGGYMQEITGGAITIRVPADHFNDAVNVVEKAGEVVDRQLKAQDVTEEMLDLGIRQNNAENLRQRLLAILAKADKVEDAIKVETELARVSAELDTIKGKIRYMQSQIAMATIRVDLNGVVLQNARGNGARLPFDWIESLGDGLVAGEVQQSTRKAGFFSHGPRFRPPAGFVRYYEEQTQTEAMDGGGLLLRVKHRENVDAAPSEFWGKLARRAIVEGRSVAVAGEEQTPQYYLIRGIRDVGGRQLGYLLAVKRSDRGIAIFEAWGPREQFDGQYDALRQSALSADPN
jgi:hypothetical protein